MKSSSVTIQVKATEQYFPVVLLIFQYFTKLFLRNCLCYRVEGLTNILQLAWAVFCPVDLPFPGTHSPLEWPFY